MPGAHSRLSPSSASRWMVCHGAARRIEGLSLPAERSSVFAAEGTAAHWIREMCLSLGVDAYDWIDTDVRVGEHVFTCDDEMASFLQPGIDRVREFGGIIYVERRVDTTPWVGTDAFGRKQFGTLDCGIVQDWDDGEVIINDLKFGMGVPVQAVGNKQLRIYALAFCKEFCDHLNDESRIRIMIDQPRHSAGGGEWIITFRELREFGEDVRAAALANNDSDPSVTPSVDGCQWCPCSKIDGACPEFEAWNLSFLGLDFEDLDADPLTDLVLTDRDGITPQRRRFINAHSHVIRGWLDRLHADEIGDVLEQGPAHGVKAVLGRFPRRKHADEEKSEAWLRRRGFADDQIFNTKLVSPAQIEKLLGRGVFPKSLVDQGEPKPVLVPVEDERPAIIRHTEFEDLGADDDDYLL